MTWIRAAWSGVAMLGLCTTAGCAGGPKGAREGAALLAGYTIHIQTEAATFAAFRAELARLRQARMNRLEKNAIETEARIESDVQAWRLVTLGQKDVEDSRVRLYEAIRRSTQAVFQQGLAVDQLREDRDRTLRETTSAVQVRARRLDEVAKALADLAREPDLEAEARFLGQFFGDVKESIESLKKEAEKDAKEDTSGTEGSEP